MRAAKYRPAREVPMIALEDAPERLRELYLALLSALLAEFNDPDLAPRPAVMAITARFLHQQGITVKSFGQARSGLSKLHEAAMRAPFTVVPVSPPGAEDGGDDESK